MKFPASNPTPLGELTIDELNVIITNLQRAYQTTQEQIDVEVRLIDIRDRRREARDKILDGAERYDAHPGHDTTPA